MDLLQKFNDTFLEFTEDVLKVFPNDSEFQMFNLAIKGALLVDKLVVLTSFKDHVAQPYGDRILARDETFLMTHDYTHVTNEHHEAEAIIDKVKTYWGDMQVADREAVWQYLRVMVLLVRKIEARAS